MLHVLLMSRVLFVCRMSYVCMCTPHTPNTRAGSLTMGPWSVIVSRHIHTQLARVADRSIYIYTLPIYIEYDLSEVYTPLLLCCVLLLCECDFRFFLSLFSLILCVFFWFFFGFFFLFCLSVVYVHTQIVWCCCLFGGVFPSSLTTHQRSTGNVFSASFSAKRSHVYHGYL